MQTNQKKKRICSKNRIFIFKNKAWIHIPPLPEITSKRDQKKK